MKPMKLLLCAALVTATLSGCVTDSMLDYPLMPGKITDHKALYDGVREVNLKPAWTLETSGLKLGLFWRSPMKGKVLVIAEVSGIQTFDPHAPLLFKIDGKTVILKPANTADRGGIETDDYLSAGFLTQTQKAFLSDRGFLKRILSSKKTLVRAQLIDGYVDGRFTLEPEKDKLDGYEQILAYRGFSSFYEAVWP